MVKRTGLLCTLRHIAHECRMRCQLILTEDDGIARTGSIRLLHLRLHAAPRVVHEGTHTAAPQLMQQGERRLCRRITECDEEYIRCRRLHRQEILLLQCEQDALQSSRKTDGGGGIPSELLDQSVIASAPRDGTLCAERRIGDLVCRLLLEKKKNKISK